MNGASLALAFGAGMLATVNPCGFAMLPAYLGFFLSSEDASTTVAARSSRPPALRVVTVVGVLTAGFVITFMVFAFALELLFLPIEEFLPYVTVVIGVVLVVAAIAMLRGWNPVVSTPKLNKGGGDRTLRSMLLFGISYAVASISCTIPVFLAVTGAAFASDSAFGVVAVFLAYGLGMGLLLLAVTGAVATARDGLVRRFRASARFVSRLSGALLVVAGLYVTYFGIWEIRVLRDPDVSGGPGEWVTDLNQAISDALIAAGPLRVGAVIVGVGAATASIVTGHRSARRLRPTP